MSASNEQMASLRKHFRDARRYGRQALKEIDGVKFDAEMRALLLISLDECRAVLAEIERELAK